MPVEIAIIGDAGRVLEDMVRLWQAAADPTGSFSTPGAGADRPLARRRNSFAYKMNNDVIMPQYAIQRLYALTKDMDTYITTEVGQHRMVGGPAHGFRPGNWTNVRRLEDDGLRPAGRARRAFHKT